jgi:threonine dehydratase
MTPPPPGIADIVLAARRLAPHAHRTPVLTCRTLDTLSGRQLYFKCENLQRCGAFKFRGALNAVLALSTEDAARGVVTDSSGNHGQALAEAARIRGIPAHIVMPSDAPIVKQKAVAGYGGQVILCEPSLESRSDTVARVQAETGATLISSHDDPDIIAGQGTTAIEFLDETGPLDALIAPVGGGGLVSGVGIAAQTLQPGIRIIAAEPSGADDAARSLAAGYRIPSVAPKTVAKGLLVGLGPLTWSIFHERVERVITVDDASILSAMKLIWERMKIIIEPSSAVAIAAVLSPEFRALDALTRVGIVVSGGNVDLDDLQF